jgi:hypothetical protein
MVNEMRCSFPGLPKRGGLLAIKVYVDDQMEEQVSLIGDRAGLLYFATLVRYMAEIDVQSMELPDGERVHIPLFPGRELLSSSVVAEICRAEAKGDGALPEYFLNKS